MWHDLSTASVAAAVADPEPVTSAADTVTIPAPVKTTTPDLAVVLTFGPDLNFPSAVRLRVSLRYYCFVTGAL
jgi:hypothetical protein